MLPEQWELFKRAARMEKLDRIPMALIIDSPWIPGYLGIKHLDYFLDPELWFHSNLKIMREFPDIIFVPSWWMEYGMAAEQSALGANTIASTVSRTSIIFPSTKWRPTASRRSRCIASRCTGSAFSTAAISSRW